MAFTLPIWGLCDMLNTYRHILTNTWTSEVIMRKLHRRDFIKLSATAGLTGALWEPLLQRALAVEAHNATRSINDVEHIVILMQENRSFDHYFGAMRGVRGVGDQNGGAAGGERRGEGGE